MFELAKRPMAVLWVADLPAEERLERARLLAKELAAGAAVAEGRVDELLESVSGPLRAGGEAEPLCRINYGNRFPEEGRCAGCP